MKSRELVAYLIFLPAAVLSFSYPCLCFVLCRDSSQMNWFCFFNRACFLLLRLLLFKKWMHLVIFITGVFNLSLKLTALKLVIPLQSWRVFLKLWISENGRKWSVGFCLEITALFFLHSQVLGPLLLNFISHFAQIVSLSSEVQVGDKNFCLTKISLIIFLPLSVMGK